MLGTHSAIEGGAQFVVLAWTRSKVSSLFKRIAQGFGMLEAAMEQHKESYFSTSLTQLHELPDHSESDSHARSIQG